MEEGAAAAMDEMTGLMEEQPEMMMEMEKPMEMEEEKPKSEKQ